MFMKKEWVALLLAGGGAFSLPVLMENHMFDQPLIRFARTRHDPAVLRGLSGILTCNDVGFYHIVVESFKIDT